MTYLIAQIWLFIAVAAAVGLLFGWLFHGGVASARLKELRHSLAHARAEVDDQRREAAELAARAERRGAGVAPSEVVALQGDLRQARDRIGRLEAETRNAVTAADRYAEEAEELRHRISELTSRSGGTSAEERAAWRERMSELEQETESLRRRLEARGAEADESLRGRVAELEAEVESKQERIAELQARTAEPAQDEALLDRLRTLEADADDLRRQLSERAAAATLSEGQDGRIAALEAEAEDLRRRLSERVETSAAADVQQDRISELETEAEALRARLATLEREIADPLEAQILRLQADLENAQALQGMQAFAAAAAETDELAALRGERDRLQEQLAGRAADEAELERTRERIAALEADLADARTRVADAEQRARAAGEAAAARPQPAVANGFEEVQTEANRIKWRNSYLTTRIHFLETRLKNEEARRNSDYAPVDPADEGPLAAARAEIARLEARLAEVERTSDRSGQPAPNVEQAGGSLEWRNRYLASRIRYLEQQLEGRGGKPSDDEGADETGDLRFKLAEAEERLKEFAKLKAKASELERALEAAGGEAAEAGARAEAQRALEWRVRYLSSRVKYLEDRLSKADPGSDPSDGGPAGNGDGGQAAPHNGA